MDNQGIEKAALGIRYLIKYIENGRIENFKIVKDCVNEMKLWSLITYYCNSIDVLKDTIPDFILENIFEMKTFDIEEETKETIHNIYGKGIKTKSDLPYKEQFTKIRNLLSHGHFTFDGNMIKIYSENYEAEFDLKWLERLVSVALSSTKYDLKKGMSDVSLLSTVYAEGCTIEEFKELCDEGQIQLYKVTSLTGNKETMLDTYPLKKIGIKDCTFELIFQSAVTLMRSNKLDYFSTHQENMKQIKVYFKEIEEFFENRIKLELVPIKISEEILNNPCFQELSYEDKLKYLIRKAKHENALKYDFSIQRYMLELFDEIDKDEISDLTLAGLKDAFNYLIKVYTNIYFGGIKNRNSGSIAEKHNLNCRYAYASNIYKEYLKVLNRSYKELEDYKGSYFSKKNILSLIKEYTILSEDVKESSPYRDFDINMRNSVIHSQVEFKDDLIRFYVTGRKLWIPHFNKKSKEWEDKEFINKRAIWEMITNNEDYLKLLDELYEKSNIEVQVNISKYCKRRSYLN